MSGYEKRASVLTTPEPSPLVSEGRYPSLNPDTQTKRGDAPLHRRFFIGGHSFLTMKDAHVRPFSHRSPWLTMTAPLRKGSQSDAADRKRLPNAPCPMPPLRKGSQSNAADRKRRPNAPCPMPPLRKGSQSNAADRKRRPNAPCPMPPLV